MKTEFKLVEEAESVYPGHRMWIESYKEAETPEMPILDLHMAVTVCCNVTFCRTRDLDCPDNWISVPVCICGEVAGRRAVVNSRGESHMVYEIAPSAATTNDLINMIVQQR
jgi:hypothetical protein